MTGVWGSCNPQLIIRKTSGQKPQKKIAYEKKKYPKGTPFPTQKSSYTSDFKERNIKPFEYLNIKFSR